MEPGANKYITRIPFLKLGLLVLNHSRFHLRHRTVVVWQRLEGDEDLSMPDGKRAFKPLVLLSCTLNKHFVKLLLSRPLHGSLC